MPRAAECLADKAGRVEVEIEFSVDAQGRRRIAGIIEADVSVTCQRCLAATRIGIREPVDLVVVPDEESARAIDADFDPWICQDNRIVLADLVEEQLLLGLPLVSVHESGPCAERTHFFAAPEQAGYGGDSKADEAERQNPFAILAALRDAKSPE